MPELYSQKKEEEVMTEVLEDAPRAFTSLTCGWIFKATQFPNPHAQHFRKTVIASICNYQKRGEKHLRKLNQEFRMFIIMQCSIEVYLAGFTLPLIFLALFVTTLKGKNLLLVVQLLFNVEPLFSCQPGAKAALATEVSKLLIKEALSSSIALI